MAEPMGGMRSPAACSGSRRERYRAESSTAAGHLRKVQVPPVPLRNAGTVARQLVPEMSHKELVARLRENCGKGHYCLCSESADAIEALEQREALWAEQWKLRGDYVRSVCGEIDTPISEINARAAEIRRLLGLAK